MSEVFTPHVEYYRDLSQSESTSVTRYGIKLINSLRPDRVDVASDIYRYLRIIDRAVDQGISTEAVTEGLYEEKHALLSESNTPLFEEYVAPHLDIFSPENKLFFLKSLNLLLSGLTIDNQVRKTQTPLDERQLTTRNFADLWPAVSIFNLIMSDSRAKPHRATVRLMNTWGTYDNIADLTEDLTNGLILISAKDMKRYDFEFVDGQPLPKEKLRNYFNDKRLEVRRSLRKDSKAIFGCGISPHLAIGLYTYFQTRQFKLKAIKDSVFEADFKLPPDIAPR